MRLSIGFRQCGWRGGCVSIDVVFPILLKGRLHGTGDVFLYFTKAKGERAGRGKMKVLTQSPPLPFASLFILIDLADNEPGRRKMVRKLTDPPFPSFSSLR